MRTHYLEEFIINERSNPFFDNVGDGCGDRRFSGSHGLGSFRPRLLTKARCYFFVAALLAGCASQPPAPVVIVKHDLAPPPRITIPPDPMAALSPDVQAAIRAHQTPTLHDGIATIYPYSPNEQWKIYCTPLQPTEIRLNPDETTDKDSVVIGDSLRWAIKVSRQAVMVEPLGTTADPNMMTTMIIATNRRSYHFLLRLRSKPMAAVQFYYPDDVRQLEATRQIAQAEAAKQATDPPAPATKEASAQ